MCWGHGAPSPLVDASKNLPTNGYVAANCGYRVLGLSWFGWPAIARPVRAHCAACEGALGGG